MSCVEVNTGKIKMLKETDQDGVEVFCRSMCRFVSPKKFKDISENGFKSYEHSWLGVLNDELYNQNKNVFFTYRNGCLYKVYDITKREAGDFFVKVNKTGDRTYEFITQFYNGDTCLEEILNDELDELK